MRNNKWEMINGHTFLDTMGNLDFPTLKCGHCCKYFSLLIFLSSLCECRTHSPSSSLHLFFLLNTYHHKLSSFLVPSLLSSPTILLTSVQHQPPSLSSLSDLDITPPTPSSSPSFAGYPFSRHPRPIIVRFGPPPPATFTPPSPVVYLSFILDLLLICISLIQFVLQSRGEWAAGHRVEEPVVVVWKRKEIRVAGKWKRKNN